MVKSDKHNNLYIDPFLHAGHENEAKRFYIVQSYNGLSLSKTVHEYLKEKC